MNAVCRVHRLGCVPYQQAWDLQKAWAAEIAAGTRPPSLLLLEHPHVYTFGRQGHEEHLLWDAAERARRGVQVVWVDRGGDVTYHGPGQLVGYPLLLLAPGGLLGNASPQGRPRLPQADYVGYVRRLEQVIIQTLAAFGLRGFPIAGMTGVWVQPDAARPPAKIAAIGVKVDVRGVSQHGFALNVAPDMTYWQGIIGCGLKGFAVTSMAACLPAPPPLDVVADVLITVFKEIFAIHTMEEAHAP
ncbi:MAG: lipoyl(octanoyl) transferase LipB [Anaerolineales bacterium]